MNEASGELHLVRHGETAWTTAHRHNGRTDLPLNERGRAKAAGLRPMLGGLDFEHVFCSPLRRALETSALAFPHRAAVVCQELTEWDYGDFEGLTVEQIRRTDASWTPWTHGFPGGETLEQVTMRAEEFLRRVSGCGGRVLVFSHGHLLRILAARRLDFPAMAASRLALDPAATCVIGVEYERAAIRSWNRVAHG